MFRYEAESLIIPQREHANLAAQLVKNWGNSHFDLPNIPLDVLFQGIAKHDNGYPEMDQCPIGEVSSDKSLELIKANYAQEFSDPKVAAIVKFHNLRLSSYRQTNDYQKVHEALAQDLREFMEQRQLDYSIYEWTDRITDFCDSLAFDLSLGKSTDESNEVYVKLNDANQTEIKYKIDPLERTITVSPWPFSSPEFTVKLVGYPRNSYPNDSKSINLQFKISSNVT